MDNEPLLGIDFEPPEVTFTRPVWESGDRTTRGSFFAPYLRVETSVALAPLPAVCQMGGRGQPSPRTLSAGSGPNCTHQPPAEFPCSLIQKQ